MMSAVNTFPITTYVSEWKKRRVMHFRELDRRMTASKVLEDLIDKYLDQYEREMFPHSPNPQSPKPRR